MASDVSRRIGQRVARLVAALAAASTLAACGGGGEGLALSPSAPSAVSGAPTGTGAVISGRVNSVAAAPVGPAASDQWAAAGFSSRAGGITVTVVGTGKATTVDSGGQFVLTEVPPGTVQLKFSGSGVDAMVTISGVSATDRIEISVTVAGTSARVDSDRRSSNGVEVNGLIASLNATARTFVVGGETVSVPVGTVIRHGSTSLQFSDLKVGDKVQVKGARANGVVTATEVKREEVGGGTPTPTPAPNPTPGSAEVKGAISGLTGTCPSLAFMVGTTRVTTSSATLFRDGPCLGLKNGTVVEAKGPRAADGSIAAVDVENKSNDEDEDDDDDDDRSGSSNGDARVEGTASGITGMCPSISFSVGGSSIRTDAKTDFRDPCSAVKNNVKVKVRGTRQAGGAILATRVELD